MKFNSQAALILIVVLLSQEGCISVGSSQPQQVQQVWIQGSPGSPEITVGDLDQLARNYADRLVFRVGAASDQLKQDELPEERRVQAHRLKLGVALAAYDVVTSPAGTPHVPDAAQHLLDLAILTELLAIRWIDEDGAFEMFGERGEQLLTEALGSCRKNIWELARLAMDPEQIEQLKNLVHQWRQQNPRNEWITRVRLDEIVAGKEGAGFTRSVVEKYTPVESALRAVDEARLLGQQSFFYLKRLPLILDWTAEASVSDALTVPKVGALIQGIQDTLTEIAKTTSTFEQLMGPTGKAPAINSTVEAVRESLVQAGELVRDARGLEAVFHEHEPKKDALPPVDIGKVAIQVGASAREATLLVRETRALAESPSAVENVDRVLARTSKSLTESSQEVINHLTIRLLEIVLVISLVILLTKVVMVLVRKRRAAAASPTPW
jgi:hypothetical protein